MKLLYKHDNEVIDVIFEDCDGNLRVINKNDTSKEGEYGSIKSFLKDFEDAPELYGEVAGMKLRNRKTGITGELHYEPDKEYHFTVATEDPADMTIHKTLAELNEEWEDYNPAEPLIKDENIRKAVRAWAVLTPSAIVRYNISDQELYTYSDYIRAYSISFPICLLDLCEGKDYTIAELCGEEE